ncbi:MAG: YfhO family protein [Clostridia bacterium]|nr:YfhO family protein [Clostridia bacterium]
MAEKTAKTGRLSDQNKNTRLFFLAAFLIPVVAILISFIRMGIRPFGDNSLLGMDLWSQYFPMLRHQYLSRREFAASLFSWDGALGTDTFVQNAYYCNSPFNFLLLLAPVKYLVDALDYLILLKFGLAGFNFAVYCRYKYNKIDIYTVVCAGAYALCSYCLAFISQIMWFDAVLFFPIILMGFERLMQEKKPLLYCIMLAVTMYSGFYISFSVCLFLALYFFVYAAENYNTLTLKGVLTGGLRFALYSLLAAGMAAFVLLPVYFGLGTTIASDIPAPTSAEFYHKIWEYLAKTLPLTKTSLQYGVPNIYSGCFMLVMLPLFLMNKKILPLKKILYTALVVFMFFSMNLNFLDYVWHGFHFPNQLPGRWTFIFSFIIIIMCYDVLRNLKSINIPSVLISAGIAAAILIVVKVLPGKEPATPRSLLLGAFFVAMYTLILVLTVKYRTDGAKTFCILLAAAMAAEMFMNAAVVLAENTEVGDVPKYIAYDKDMDRFSETYAAPDDDFYRTDMYYNWTFDHCQMFRLRGITYYSSTMSGGAYRFFQDIGYRVYAKNVSTVYCPYSPVLNAVLNIGYVADLAMQYIPDYLTETEKLRTISVLKNEKRLPVMFAASADILSWEADSLLPFYEQQNRFFSAIVGEDVQVYKKLPDGKIDAQNAVLTGSNATWTAISFSRQNAAAPVVINYTFTLDRDGPVYLCHNYKKGDMTIDVNGVPVTLILYREPLKYLGAYKKGDTIHVSVTNTESAVGTAGLSLYTMDKPLFESYYAQLAAGGATSAKTTAQGLICTVNNAEEQLMFTSVPAQGMTCYLDGETTNMQIVDGYLAAVAVPGGEHTVEFKYTVTGLKEGILVSACSLAALALITVGKYLFLRKKKK